MMNHVTATDLLVLMIAYDRALEKTKGTRNGQTAYSQTRGKTKVTR